MDGGLESSSDESAARPEKMIRPTRGFGNVSNIRSPDRLKKERYKQSLYQTRFVDHASTFAYKDKGQRGRARKAQTFLVSFVYEGSVTEGELWDFVKMLDEEHGLQGHFEPTVFRNIDAWQVVIADTEVVLKDAVRYAREEVPKH